jgi:hypothetical protein
MLTMFTYALGGVDLDIMLGSSNPEASIVLSLLYQFAMGTVLMSLLTGVCMPGTVQAEGEGEGEGVPEVQAGGRDGCVGWQDVGGGLGPPSACGRGT